MHKVVVIDADGLVYHSSKDTLLESLEIIDEKIHNIFDKTGAGHYAMYISRGKYFRHQIYPEYKASRERYQTQLKWVRTLKSYLEEKWKARMFYGAEADDMVAYHANVLKEDEYEVIISSPDKDILHTIPGKHFNYTYRLEDKEDPNSLIKGWWVETSKENAEDYRFYQMIVGDSGDNIKGVEGRGKVYFEKNKPWTFDKALETYQERYGEAQGIYKFQKNYRLLHMLDSEEDFLREVGEVPTDLFTDLVYPIEGLEELGADFDIDKDLF